MVSLDSTATLEVGAGTLLTDEETGQRSVMFPGPVTESGGARVVIRGPLQNCS